MHVIRMLLLHRCLCVSLRLFEKYGYYREALETKTYKGIEGAEKIKSIMNRFRTESLPFEIERMLDYSNGIDGLPKSDVLKFFLKDGAWFAVRPSGTEPKVKLYIGVRGSSEENAQEQIDEILNKLSDLMQ